MATASARQQAAEKVVGAVACPYCGAQKGRWCTTGRGHYSATPHGARYKAAQNPTPEVSGNGDR